MHHGRDTAARLSAPHRSATRNRSLLRRCQLAIPKGFAGNVSWQYAATAASIGGNLVYMLLVATRLGPSDYGVMALGLSVTTLVFGAVDFRLHEAVIRYLSEFEHTRDAPRMHAFTRASIAGDVIVKILASTILFALTPWLIASLFRDARAQAVVYAAGAAVFFQTCTVSTSTGLLRVFDRFRSYAIVRMAGIAVQIVAAAIVLGAGLGPSGVLMALAATNLLVSVALGVLALRALSHEAPLGGQPAPIRLLRERAKEIAGFAASNYGFAVTGLPVRDLDVAMVGWYASLADVGAYRFAKNILAAAWALSDPVFLALYPVVARFWMRRQFVRLSRFLQLLVLVLTAAAALSFLALFFVAPPVVSLLLDPGYEQVGSILRWMSWAVLGWMPLLWVHAVVCAADRPIYSLFGALVSNAIATAAYFMLIPVYGVQGAAFAHALGVVVAPATAAAIARRKSLIPPRAVNIKTPGSQFVAVMSARSREFNP